MATAHKQSSPPKCYCCKSRYATGRFSNGSSYCTECASDHPKRGTELSDYPAKPQYFGSIGPYEKYTVCQCCQFAFTTKKEVTTLFYKNQDSFNYCYNCAPNHKVSSNDPDFGLNHEGLRQLSRVIRENK